MARGSARPAAAPDDRTLVLPYGCAEAGAPARQIATIEATPAPAYRAPPASVPSTPFGAWLLSQGATRWRMRSQNITADRQTMSAARRCGSRWRSDCWPSISRPRSNLMIDPAGPLPPSPLSERALMAIAVITMKLPGDEIEMYVATEIGRLALADDAEGVATWKAVGARIQAIKDASVI